MRQTFEVADRPAPEPRVSQASRLDPFTSTIDEMFGQDLEVPTALHPSARRVLARLAEGCGRRCFPYWAKSDLVAKHHSVIEGEAAPARRLGA